jgi:hypothetical protein
MKHGLNSVRHSQQKDPAQPSAPCADRGNGECRFVAAPSIKAHKVIHPIFEPSGAVAIPVMVRQAGRHGKSVTECANYYELLLSAGAAAPRWRRFINLRLRNLDLGSPKTVSKKQ